MNTLEKIKALVFGTELKFADLPMEEGILRIDTEVLEIGSKAIIVDLDGVEVAPEAGDLTLADGTIVTVDEMGVVTAIENLPVEEEIPAEEVMEDIVVDEVPVVDAPEIAEVIDELTPEEVTPEDSAVIAEEIVALINEEVAKVTESMNSKFEEIKNIMLEMANDSQKFAKEFNEFKKSPSGKSISEMEFSSNPDDSASKLEDRLERIKNLRKNKN